MATLPALLVFTALIATCTAPPPDARQLAGPCIGMDCLHGILMHGDDKQDVDHNVEHMERKEAEKKELEGKKSLTTDAEEVMHGEAKPHSHDNDPKEPVKHPESKVSDPHTLMHGEDAGHVHEEKEAPPPLKIESGTNSDPESLMHGGEGGHVHDTKEAAPPLNIKSGTGDPDSIMHGEENAHEHKEAPPAEKILSLTSDPDALLHGGQAHAHDEEHRPMSGGGEPKGDAKDKTDPDTPPPSVKDYLKWKRKEDEGKAEAEGSWGFSLPFISDSFLSDIDFAKWKYLSHLFGGGEKSEEKKKVVKSRYEDGDMRHELEGMGEVGSMPVHHVQSDRDEE